MTSIGIELTGAQAIAKKIGRLTSGMVGVPVKFSVDEHWDGLNIIPVFKCGDITKDNIFVNCQTTVPHELLQQVGFNLYVGAEGRSEDGRLVIPTTWVEVGQVYQGVKATGDLGLEPTPSQFDHFMAEVGKIDNKVMNAVDDVVASGLLRGEKGDPGEAGTDGKFAYEYSRVI